MKIQLSDHFTYNRLLKFVFPSIVMMIFTSVYGVVDGFFVSNYAGKTQFAAVNLIMPMLMILGAIGFMIGTGGSALVAGMLGEGRKEEAGRIFSFLIYVTIAAGLVLTVAGIIFIRPVARLFGADEGMLEYCVVYGRIILVSLIPFMLQNVFQSFLVTAEKPQIGLAVTVAAGIVNIVLDAVLVAVLRLGIVGAAVATAASQMVGGIVPFVYFILPNSSSLRLASAQTDGRALLKACTNGASELMSNISMSIVNILYNFQLMRFAGEDGVAAYGVLMYVNFIFVSVFLGYSVGSAPIVGYHNGAKNYGELKNMYKKSLVIMGVSGIILTAAAELLALPLSKIFVGYDAGLLEMTRRAFTLYSFSFLFAGFNIYASSFFTALNNGAVSAAISFIRTLVFQIAAVLILPEFFGLDGIWFSIVAAEALSLLVSAAFLIKMRSRYHYA